MAIAGYNADQAPKTFAKMEEYQAQMMGKAAANASYIQDHPRSANRVKLLEVRDWVAWPCHIITICGTQ
jgi:predicted Zn-dependent protease